MRCPVCHRRVAGATCPHDGAAVPVRVPPVGPWPDIPGVVIEGVLGAGAHGVVLAGRCGERAVAVKLGDERLAREAELLARIGPPHVPVLVEHGAGYLITERAAGRSLAEGVAAGELAVVAGALFGALAAVHALGVVHGDLTPENVFWDGARVR